MASFPTASKCVALGLIVSSMVASAGPIKIIEAKRGASVTLPCKAAENKQVFIVEWTKTDLEPEAFVLLLRANGQFDPDGAKAFKNRVDLKDVKNGDASLLLRNIGVDDTGTYECRVVLKGYNRWKRAVLTSNPISVVNLTVLGQTGESRDEGQHNDGRREGGWLGLVASGVLICLIVSRWS